MARYPDMIGRVFGRLTVVEQADSKNGMRRWRCKCACGGEVVSPTEYLTSGDRKSCGCMIGGPVKHGHAKKSNKTPEYKIWCSMKDRCLNPKNDHFHGYGGRGIGVCQTWQNDYSAFFAHVGPRPSPRHSLDRIDNDKGYEPGNVRWATASEQAKNKRKPKPRGKTVCGLTARQIAEQLGCVPTTIQKRMRQGLPPDEIFRRDRRDASWIRGKPGHNIGKTIKGPDGRFLPKQKLDGTWVKR